MTTDRPSRPRTSPLELRLYTAALLAAIYTISWRAIGGQAPAAEPVAGRPPGAVWIDQLPPAMQPAVTLPAGWQRAAASEATPASAPARVVRVPDRAIRVRTRSS